MPRPPRRRRPGCSAHVTVRCNNRAFDLQRKEPRLFVLHALARAAEKFGARIYAVAVMSNHVHYLIEPRRPDELPRVMHWLNWYTAMGLNRLLGRRGHFWEARYHASWVSNRYRPLQSAPRPPSESLIPAQAKRSTPAGVAVFVVVCFAVF